MSPTSTRLLLSGLPRLHERGPDEVALNDLLRTMRKAARPADWAPLIDQLDQRWRSAPPDQQAAVAPLYARALHAAAVASPPLELTYALAKVSKDPIARGIHALNLLEQGQAPAALNHTLEILSQYVIDADPALPTLLDALVTSLGSPGWVGLCLRHTVQIRLLPADSQPRGRKVAIEIDGQPYKTTPGANGLLTVALPAAILQASTAPRFALHGTRLLSYQFAPSRIAAIDGRAGLEGTTLRGRVSYTRAPAVKPAITIESQTGAPKTIRALQRISYAHWIFAAALGPRAQHKANLAVHAHIPEVGRFVFPDSPVPTGLQRLRRRPAKATIGPAPNHTATATVIIPVYNNLVDTVRCIRAVAAALPPGWDVLVIDDASTEPGAEQALAALAGIRIQVIRHALNLGYAAAVNTGIGHCENDVILLNSDALVFPGVLEHLQAIAAASPEVGTVTAASTDDSIAGINLPRQHEAAAIETARRVHQALRTGFDQTPIDVPTGVGHCLYIKRYCLETTGPLDAQLFPAGYGEETDFCFRATMRGWRHQIATGAFCFHAGGKSFSQRRMALLERAAAIMTHKYPGYETTVRAALAHAPLHHFKRRIREQLLRTVSEPFVLLVTTWPRGGVHRVVVDQCNRLRKEGLTPLVLHPGDDLKRSELHLWHSGMGSEGCSYQMPHELEGLLELLGWLPLRALHIHHLMGIPLALIERLVDQPGLETHLYAHDYCWACTRVNLMGRQASYCGVPSLAECGRCKRELGSLLPEKIGVAALRQRSAQLFGKVGTVHAVSTDITLRLSDLLGLPPARFSPYALETTEAHPAPIPRRQSPQTIKVAVMGGIVFHKGYQVLLDCLKDSRRRQLPLEFVMIGASHDNTRLLRQGGITITGHYKESEARYLLEKANPDVFFCSSIVPESWCYTLTYALRLGLPILSFDIGAQAMRLRERPASKLVPLGTQAATLNDFFLQFEHWGTA